MAHEIILTFDFEFAPTAGDLGEVFSALSRDYRDASNGGTLVVTRVESGSIIVTLTDAALTAAPYAAVIVGGTISTMAAIDTIDKFAENLKKWFGRAKTDEGKRRLYRKGKKSPGQRSVEAIINTAAKTRSRARVKYSKANGEILEAEVSPAEAIEIRHVTEPDAAQPKKVEATVERALTVRPEVESAVEKLRKAGSENLSQSQIEAVVDIIVTALQSSGAEHALPEIASQLEMHGLFEFAGAVRRHIRGSGGTRLPPIATT
jgi:hypothetical protein